MQTLPDDPDPTRPSPEAASVDPGASVNPSADGEGEGEGAGTAERSVHDVIAALQAEAADYKDRWMRAQAETENVRKRYEREKEETAKYAITKFARGGPDPGADAQNVEARHRCGACRSSRAGACPQEFP